MRARAPAHALDAGGVELVADVVELAVEAGEGPPQAGGGVDVARQVHGAGPGPAQPGLGDGQDEQALAGGEGLLITEADVPPSYYDLQKRIARERGYGDMEITNEMKEETVEVLQDDQAESLMEWSEYLRSDGNGHIYPDWFKVYVWESLKKMGEFDREKGKFKKRTKSTTAPWPELNAEALAYVWDKINHGVVKGDAVDDEKLANLLNNGNFSTLYAHALHEAETGGITPELREITEGTWVKYDQTQSSDYSDSYEENGEYAYNALIYNEAAMSLSQSLYSKGTGWCSARFGIADRQLSMGDFYVYYTLDDQGNYTIPRIAIRSEEHTV